MEHGKLKLSKMCVKKATLLAQLSTENTNYAIFVRIPVSCGVQQKNKYLGPCTL